MCIFSYPYTVAILVGIVAGYLIGKGCPFICKQAKRIMYKGESFFTTKDIVFLGVCTVGMLIHAATVGGFSILDAYFMGACALLVVVYDLARINNK